MLNHLFSMLFLIVWVTLIFVTQPDLSSTTEQPNNQYNFSEQLAEIQSTTNYHYEQIRCLALNAYFEARNSSWDDMVATSYVVLNRVESKRFRNNVCAVIEQPRQFSWTHDGRPDRPDLSNEREAAAWSRSIFAAVGVYFNLVKDDPTRGATHYHAEYVEPYWTKNNRIKIGKHYFMRVA